MVTRRNGDEFGLRLGEYVCMIIRVWGWGRCVFWGRQSVSEEKDVTRNKNKCRQEEEGFLCQFGSGQKTARRFDCGESLWIV